MKTIIAYILAFTVNLKRTAEAINTARTADDLSHTIKNTNTKERTNI